MRGSPLQASNQSSQRTQGENITEFLAWVVLCGVGLGPFTNRIWIRFVAHVRKMLRAKARERSAKGGERAAFGKRNIGQPPFV